MKSKVRFEHGLTEREHEVFCLIQTGETNRVVADSLCVSIDTVKSHLRFIYKKLGVKNSKQMIARFPKVLEKVSA